MGITHASAGSQTPGTAGIGVCWVLSRVVGAPEHRGVPVAYRMHVTARAAIFITTFLKPLTCHSNNILCCGLVCALGRVYATCMKDTITNPGVKMFHWSH